MFCEAWPDLKFFIFTSHVPSLLYYSHIPAIIVSLWLGFFVFFKNRSLLSKLLLSISSFFSIWVFFNLIAWTSPDSRLVMFIWSFFGVLYSFIYVLCLYFVYVFIDKKDISLKKKIILTLLVLPIILFIATGYNLEGFDLPNCEAQEGFFYLFYYYFLGLFISLWIIVLAIARYRKADHDLKKQIVLLTVGMELFLFSFFIAGFLASYLVDKGLIKDFGLEQYGLFGMTVFMAFLTYLIVRYKAFDIKLIGAQALMVSIIILVGSQFFFIRNTINQVLNGITLVLASGAGVMLIRSIKSEVKRKEQLQVMSDRLAVANDQLRQLDNAKSEFISIASHQLRTPLTAIKGFISLMLEGSYGKVDPKQKEIINKVYQSNERLINLVEDLLNLSRIESGRMEYSYEKVDLKKICQEIMDTFLLKAKENKLYLHFLSNDETLPEINTDRNKLREIISNLVDNALKYTPRGGVNVRIKQKGENIQILISDTGIGIPQEEIPYLFAKFSRGKDVSRLNTGGTGLGLHVGKRMLEEMGGQVWAESEGAGKGSTFIVEIPIEHKEE